GETRTLGADGFLGHLDQHFLTLREHFFDRLDRGTLTLRTTAATASATIATIVAATVFATIVAIPVVAIGSVIFDVDAAFHLEALGVGHEIAGVEEAGLVVADVDERRLDAGKNGVHTPEVDVADQAARR